MTRASAKKLLVLDDDEAGCRLIRAMFASEGYEVGAEHTAKAALARLAAEPVDLLLLDLHLPDALGLDVLEQVRGRHPNLPVVMLTAHHDVKTAVRATQLGAFDYLTKPVDHEELVVVVKRALDVHALRAEVEDLRRRVQGNDGPQLDVTMGPSPQIREVIEQVKMVASSNFTVLVLGETGTGKELVAQAIHRQSERRQKPFIALDCGAIPESLLESELFGHEKGAFTGADKRRAGRFQLAEGGTFFLDEVGNLSAALQAKLLRVLESRQVQPVGGQKPDNLDVRFVAATNDRLRAQAAEGKFRTDLFFRLAQYTIHLPPLRARVTDIGYLAQRFLEEASVELRRPVQGLSLEALEVLQRHTWPGNVRELRNVVRQAVLRTTDPFVPPDIVRVTLGRSNAPPPMPPTPSPPPMMPLPVAPPPGVPAPPLEESTAESVVGRSLREIAEEAARAAELRAIRETLQRTRGNKSQAAKTLKTDYKTLHLKMKSFGLSGRDFER